MILFNGLLYPSQKQNELLDALPPLLAHTLATTKLNPSLVIEACHQLSHKIEEGHYDTLIHSFDIEPSIIDAQRETIINFLKKDSLQAKMALELNKDALYESTLVTPPFSSITFKKQIYPLGVLFHIAAGNADGLPACSLIEGLLAGNINILKLPQADNDLSIQLLQELIRIQPLLKPYIFVFDTPSTDLQAIRQMALLSDGVVAWGGDTALSAIRQFLPPSIKLIEWGHKISFCYITPTAIAMDNLAALASHIMSTKQLLCSSCQTIFIDTDNLEDLYAFCHTFLPLLEEAATRYPIRHIGTVAQSTLQIYNAELEALFSEDSVFKGNGCSLIAKTDSELETSLMFGNCIVKRLPRQHLFTSLRKYKGYLQTAGLICCDSEKSILSHTLLSAGVLRIKSPLHMSSLTCLDAHDGDYPLRRYTRITEIDN